MLLVKKVSLEPWLGTWFFEHPYCTIIDWVHPARSVSDLKGLENRNTFLSASDKFLWEPITKLAFPPGVLVAGFTQ